jgi:hypothetical protein
MTNTPTSGASAAELPDQPALWARLLLLASCSFTAVSIALLTTVEW